MPGVAPEGDAVVLQVPSEQRGNTVIELVVRQRVHRVDQQGTNAWPFGVRVRKQIVSDWIQEGLGLAATRTGGSQEALLVYDSVMKRLLLVQMQRPVGSRQQAQPIVQKTSGLHEQSSQGLALLEVWKRLDIGPLDQLLLLKQETELPTKL